MNDAVPRRPRRFWTTVAFSMEIAAFWGVVVLASDFLVSTTSVSWTSSPEEGLHDAVVSGANATTLVFWIVFPLVALIRAPKR
ncbi:MAG: hypothetical protein HY293_03530 [Planctomycetes bacterium]|nr:hypothetical protein [Planctomycetota bacterium]